MTNFIKTQEYNTLHKWLQSQRPDGQSCEECKATGIRIEAANISGIYLKDITDYKWLCSSCHKTFDKIGKKVSEYRQAIRAKTTECVRGHNLAEVGEYVSHIKGKPKYKCKACQKILNANYLRNVKSRLA